MKLELHKKQTHAAHHLTRGVGVVICVCLLSKAIQYRSVVTIGKFDSCVSVNYILEIIQTLPYSH